MDHKKYFDEKLHQLRVVIRSQWDYLNYSKLLAWLEDNFGNDYEGKYYAIKILLHTIYYRRTDILKLIEYGLFEKIYGDIIKTKLLLDQNIYQNKSEMIAQVNLLKQKSFFVPLLDSDKPSESGNIFIGDLVHKLDIKEEKVDFHWNLTKEKILDTKILIFVDDCIGSGNQLKRFWNSNKIKAVRDACIELNIEVYYLVLLGYEKNVEMLMEQKKLEGIKIVVCDILTDKNRVFSDQNIIWNKEDNEIEKVTQYFDKIKKDRGVSFLGYRNLDFAVILNDRLPNWSLPIFWKEMIGWKSLLRRKTSSY